MLQNGIKVVLFWSSGAVLSEGGWGKLQTGIREVWFCSSGVIPDECGQGKLQNGIRAMVSTLILDGPHK
jgi:hypothetical protein